MKARRRASAKEVLELYDDAKKAVGSAGGPSYGAAGKNQLPITLETSSGKGRR
jgi:hypothetical protein